jgi:RHH-type proline utilization regulon transcriptional repressor/proline dehydrogenase/delta 1-pyrroline-5-carboxylate dehydrogenase
MPMPTRSLTQLRAAIRANYLPDEAKTLALLVRDAALSKMQRRAISDDAAQLVQAVRESSNPQLMETFLSEYGLSSREGVALMCLAEALLRVPDAKTMDDLIRDKIAPHDWSAHSGASSSIFVNASTWALMLTGRMLGEGEDAIEGTLRALLGRLGEPVIRRAVAAAMRELGGQFVLGRTIGEAVRNGRPMTAMNYLYSFDMLGEAARTEADAQRYHRAYAETIASLVGEARSDDIAKNPGISAKLSALHPRYEVSQRETILPEMTDRLLILCRAAKDAQMGLNIDAEEADRLDLSLDVIERVLSNPSLACWTGFDVVVQAYGPRAGFVIDWLHALAEQLDRRIMVRLVKGAYWDSEIKRAQVQGLPGYAVFTRKTNTDVSYIANARKLLSMTDRIYPQFATHNAHTVAVSLSGTAPAGERRQLLLCPPDRRRGGESGYDRARSLRGRRGARDRAKPRDPDAVGNFHAGTPQFARLGRFRLCHAGGDRARLRSAASLGGVAADAGGRRRAEARHRQSGSNSGNSRVGRRG